MAKLWQHVETDIPYSLNFVRSKKLFICHSAFIEKIISENAKIIISRPHCLI